MFEIDKKYHNELSNKIKLFTDITETKKSIQISFITSLGIKENMYSNDACQTICLDD